MSSAILTVDLGFGDSGKGTMVDYLVRKYESQLVVRYGGGAQAAHNVVEPGGRWHTFAQFGSGTFAGADTYLGPDMIIEPMAMENEALHLELVGVSDPLHRIIVDDRCPITTPYDAAVNRLREIFRGKDRHGSCGMGIGETRQSIINDYAHVRTWECRLMSLVRGKLSAVRSERIEIARRFFMEAPKQMDNAQAHEIFALFENREALDVIADRYFSWYRKVRHVEKAPRLDTYHTPVVFEGSQGILLDQLYGFNPYTTWSDVTLQPAYQILGESMFRGKVDTIGIVRAFMTRHGPGPFPTEDKELGFSESHNQTGRWQGEMRYGHFDPILIRYALYALRNSVKQLAVTHFDWLRQRETFRAVWYYKSGRDLFNAIPYGLDVRRLESVIPGYMSVEPTVQSVRNLIEDQVGVKIGYLSFGPTWEEKFDAH